MKQRLRRCMAGILALLMVIGALAADIPKGSSNTRAAGTEPEYMAKIVPRADGNNDNRLGQYVQVKAGKTYTLSFKLYVIEKGVLVGFKGEGPDWGGIKFVQEAYSEPGTMTTVRQEAVYTPTSDETIYVNLQCNDAGAFYIWDVKFAANDSDENLFKNADFSDGNGSFMNWTYSGWGGDQAKTMESAADSDAFAKATGRKVVKYDTKLFSTDITNREELEMSGDRQYMAKIQTGNSGYWIYQTISAEVGQTYCLSCDYYVERMGDSDIGHTALWNNTLMDEQAFEKETVSSMNIRFQTSEDWIGARFYVASNMTIYISNIRLTKEGSSVNLLKNADFSEESGSWIGWRIKDDTIQNKAESDAAKDTYGTSVIPYDSSVFSQQGGNENSGQPNTPDVPEQIPTGTPEYMAKVQLKSDANWLWMYQTLSVTEGRTYHFTCDYYVLEGEGANAVVWSDDSDAKSAVFRTGSQGALDVKYQAGSGVTGIAARFEIIPGSTVCIWNICLYEEGGDTNLLTNGSFKKEEGTFIGWSVGQSGIINNKEKSDKLKSEYGAEILKYDSSIFPQPEKPESIPTGTPDYMMKIQLPSDAKWLWVYQSLATEEGMEYQFTCNYYVQEGDGGNVVIWSGDKDAVQAALKSDTQGTIDLTYKAGKDVTGFASRFEIAPGSTVYVWNACLREKNGQYNLLTNGSFKKENGSLIGWIIGQSGMVNDKVASDTMKSKYGVEVLKYDSSIFPQPETPEGIPKGDPKYMAHLIGSHKDPSGKMHTYVNVRNSITPEAGKTYIFSCNYYDTKQDSATASLLLWSDTSKGSEGDSYGRFRATTKAGVEGRLEIEYTATEGDTYLAVSMECEPDSEVYMWNLCLIEKGKTENLLRNGSFSKGDGSWIGWSIGEKTAKTVEDSADFVATYGHKIEKFDRAKIDAMKAEDAALLSYVNPNIVFTFDDKDKYKEMDMKYIKTAAVKQDDTTATDVKQEEDTDSMAIIWIVTAVVAAGGLGTIGTVLFLKKRKLADSKK